MTEGGGSSSVPGDQESEGQAVPGHAVEGEVTTPEVRASTWTEVESASSLVPRQRIQLDEPHTLRTLGAVPAWEAVIERGRFLARRGQKGLVFGHLSAEIDQTAASAGEGDMSGHAGGSFVDTALPTDERSSSWAGRWLIDETQGSGGLAIRLGQAENTRAQRALATLPAGERVLVWGAWTIGKDGAWYWRADNIARLPAVSAAHFSSHRPSHLGDWHAGPGFVMGAITVLPEGAEPPSRAERARYVVFQVREPLDDLSDGWLIYDPGSDTPSARLLLPGERGPYGAQDYRSKDEHWPLIRGETYVVRMRRWRRGKEPDGLATVFANRAPRRLIIDETAEFTSDS